MILLSLFGLIALAVLYGIFFLIFKLIWLLCKSKRNFWPLILAGVSSVLVIAATVLLAVSAFNRLVKPFTPIMEAMSSSEPVYGQQTYTSPDNAFSLTLYDGMVPSDWIRLNELEVLVGLDTNALKAKNVSKNLLDGFVLIKQTKPEDRTPEQLLEDLSAAILQSEAGDEMDLEAVTPFDAGANSAAAIVHGTVYSDSSDQIIPTAILIAKKADKTYYVIGGGINERGGVATVQSFRFLSLADQVPMIFRPMLQHNK